MVVQIERHVRLPTTSTAMADTLIIFVFQHQRDVNDKNNDLQESMWQSIADQWGCLCFLLRCGTSIS